MGASVLLAKRGLLLGGLPATPTQLVCKSQLGPPMPWQRAAAKAAFPLPT